MVYALIFVTVSILLLLYVLWLIKDNRQKKKVTKETQVMPFTQNKDSKVDEESVSIENSLAQR